MVLIIKLAFQASRAMGPLAETPHMLRHLVLFLCVVLCGPSSARAITISVGNWVLQEDTADQQIELLLTSGDEFYTDGILRITIAAGGPKITQVFGDTLGLIPTGSLAGSIWSGGIAAIDSGSNGTYPGASGQQVVVAFQTAAAGTPQNTSGVFATLTLSTVGVSLGSYAISLTGHPNGLTEMFNGFDEETGPIPTDLVLVNGSILAVPEPASMGLGIFALAAFAVTVFQSRRARLARSRCGKGSL
jgi:hypothetical protein